MQDPMIIAAAIVLVIASIFTGWSQLINTRAAAEDRREAKISRARLEDISTQTLQKTDTVIEKAVEIHTLTNSNLSKVTASLETALSKIEGLQQLVTSLTKAKEIADTLATNQNQRTRVTDNPQVLDDIKENTENTVEAVKSLKK